MTKQTIIPRDPSLIAVAKNGEFLGYATQAQIDASDGVLTVYVSGAAPAPAPAPDPDPAPPADEPTGGDAGAKPEAVRKGPAKPGKDA